MQNYKLTFRTKSEIKIGNKIAICLAILAKLLKLRLIP